MEVKCENNCLVCKRECCKFDHMSINRPKKYSARLHQKELPDSKVVSIPPLKYLIVDAKTNEPIYRRE